MGKVNHKEFPRSYLFSQVFILASTMGGILQMLSAKLAIVSGLCLSQCSRLEYGANSFLTICLWIISEVCAFW